MNGGEPELRSPGKPDLVARRVQLAAIVSTALPGAADNHPLQGVFGGQEQESPPRLQHPRQFAQSRPRVGEVLNHPSAGDAIERIIGKGKLRQIAGHVAGAFAMEPGSRAAQHLVRKVERH